MNEMRTSFDQRLQALQLAHEVLTSRPNKKEETGNGVYERYRHPVLTAQHTPLTWRYDLNYETNPWLMERFGITTAAERGPDTLADRLWDDLRAAGGIVISPPMIGAWARLPE